MLRTNPSIKYIITLGDSLSDRGTMNNRYLLGVVPLSYITGLSEHAPIGRFTNGRTWDDSLSAMLASHFISQQETTEKRALSAKDKLFVSTDISDSLIAGGHVKDEVRRSYSLDDDLKVQYKFNQFMRNYNEGGLSSHDYGWTPSPHLKLIANRCIVSTLEKKCDDLLKDDIKLNITAKQKLESLIVEWTGANDLITVNNRPTQSEADAAITARMNNLTKLIHNGYRNFVLINMPDLSLTPRYRLASAEEQANAKNISLYFNQALLTECNKLKEVYHLLMPEFSIDIFDINFVLTNIYENLPAYGFHPEKLTVPYITSKDFRIYDGISPAPGYVFWDDIHPTAHIHALIADAFYKKYSTLFNFEPPIIHIKSPPQFLFEEFMKTYHKLLKQKTTGLSDFFKPSLKDRLPKEFKNTHDYVEGLRQILYQAQKGDALVQQSLLDLSWVDCSGDTTAYIARIVEKESLKGEYDARPHSVMSQDFFAIAPVLGHSS